MTHAHLANTLTGAITPTRPVHGCHGNALTTPTHLHHPPQHILNRSCQTQTHTTHSYTHTHTHTHTHTQPHTHTHTPPPPHTHTQLKPAALDSRLVANNLICIRES